MRLHLNTNGFGSSVLQMLLRTSIKSNLYYEIKDKIDEEQFDGMTVKRKARKCKVYGATSSHQKRNDLIEILHQRVQHHRDKFLSKDIYDELCTMVVKPNGKVEHADDAHDDLVFSYLWALYVFYRGQDLATRFHLMKTEIYTDDHYDETSYSLEEEYLEGEEIDPSIFKDQSDPINQMVEEELKILNSYKTMTFEDLWKKQEREELECLRKLEQTKVGREAVANAHHISLDYLEKEQNTSFVDITNDINSMFYGNAGEDINAAFRNPATKGNLGNLFDKL